MLCRTSYLEEYVDLWSRRDEVNRTWASVYSPQLGEHTPEMFTREDREILAERLPKLRQHHYRSLINEGITKTFLQPTQTAAQCVFSRMSLNYTADLKTRVGPCVLGGTPDCSQSGCAASVGLHWVKSVKLAGPLRIGHLLRASIGIGRAAGRIRGQLLYLDGEPLCSKKEISHDSCRSEHQVGNPRRIEMQKCKTGKESRRLRQVSSK